jgi:hypothetical protein
MDKSKRDSSTVQEKAGLLRSEWPGFVFFCVVTGQLFFSSETQITQLRIRDTRAHG